MNSEMIQEWDSWAPLILEDLKNANRKIQLFHSAAGLFGSKQEDRDRLITEELPKLIIKSMEG